MTRALRFPARAGERDPDGPVTIRRARWSDAAAAVQAFNDVFHLQRPPEYWERKFARSDGPVAFIAVDAAGRVFAQFAAWPATIRCDGARVPVLVPADVLGRRSRDAIRQKLFFRTQRAFHDYFGGEGLCAASIGFPNEVSIGVANVVKPLATLTRIPIFEVAPAAPAFWKRWWPGRSVTLLTYERTGPEFMGGVEAVWRARSATSAPPEGERTAEWARWRFDEVGKYYNAYRFHLVAGGGDCVGWCVTADTPGEFLFVDWHVAREDGPSYAALSDGMRQILERAGKPSGLAFASPAARAPFGPQLTWSDTGRAVPFAAQEYKAPVIPYADLRITFGDTDLR